MMKQNGVNPQDITPTGRNGRILKEDVLDYLKNKSKKEQPALTEKESKEAKIAQRKETEMEISAPCKTKPQQTTPQTTPEYVCSTTLQDKVIKIEGFRKAMVKTMTQSSQIPTFLYTDEFNVDKLVKLRKEMNKVDQKIKLSYMPFFIKAISYSLMQYPELNSIVNKKTGEDGLIYEYTVKKDHNISIAIDTEHGLIVPNIKRVQDKSIVQIQVELNQLREKAKNQKITIEDYKDGTFTISNIGIFIIPYNFREHWWKSTQSRHYVSTSLYSWNK
jgi:2-oxoisovalerate dehydrogenase E2 component (dihydrolipoyl transacylase)